MLAANQIERSAVMARDLNKVQMTGRLGADPEMRYTPQGHAVTTFRAASNRSWRTAEGEAHEDTEWFRVVAWNKLAEICNQWLSKGSRVYVEGRMQTRQWQDQEGQMRNQTEIIAIDIIILDTRRDGTPAQIGNTPEAIDTTPAPTHMRATSLAAPSKVTKATKVTTLPRGKDAFEEEDLPF
jgi:single-strand DNA-binding protein